MNPSPGPRQLTKQAEVVRAAVEVFLRYGYARTTMGDIAVAANISRPAVYLVFPGKEEAFTAVVRHLDDQSHAEMRRALPSHPTLATKLRYACQKWGTHGFDIMAVHPDAKDLFDLKFVAVQEIYVRFQALIVELIVEAEATSNVQATPEELARSLVFAMRGFKDTARNGKEMRRLIEVQVSLLADNFVARSKRK